jgi:uncharacterized protein
MTRTVEIVDGITSIDASAWDVLAGDMPLLRHAFLSALETSQAVGKGTGWQPYPLVVKDDGEVIAAIPLYVKSHSYGEYVFDWAWADAYQRSGFNYYPKLLSAIPFTPITSPRLLIKSPQGADELRALMLSALVQTATHHGLSSIHINFPNSACEKALSQSVWLRRTGVQFRWENQYFADFEAFLATLSHDKRKKIKQERKKVAAQNVVCKQIKGADITEAEWDFFYQCYANTYMEHRSTPYLPPAFFHQIGKSMPENILLILAYKEDVPIAAALNIYNENCLYGRYWGAIQYVPNLHFELCYYQAQLFCIAENIQYFEGGAQGEHKLARGFLPRATCSYHYILQPDFATAIAEFLQNESQGVAAYTTELEDRAPFKAMFK